MHSSSRQHVSSYHPPKSPNHTNPTLSAPKAHVAVYDRITAGDLKGAKAVQDVLADADLSQQKLGVSGLKLAVSHYFGYGSGLARSPLPSGDESRLAAQEGPLKRLVDLENSL